MIGSSLHPLITNAARGRLPDWAEVGERRRAHLESVARLLGHWAGELKLDEQDVVRWMAAGWLHDALRDADPSDLAASADDYPAEVRHGPAVASRLEEEGVADRELLEAIRYHTLGYQGLGRLGRFLYLADYLDSSRSFDEQERALLRDRLPHEHHVVLQVVCARRICHLLDSRIAIRTETMAFWNELLRAS